jgi:predicted nuclease of predicted toxin-antitoxin system
VRFLVDESVGTRLADWLRSQGHDATAIARDYPASLPDDEVLALAEREGRILITNDTDFGDLVFRARRPHRGVILFRLATETFATRADRLTVVLTEHADALAHFLVVEDSRVRIRPHH